MPEFWIIDLRFCRTVSAARAIGIPIQQETPFLVVLENNASTLSGSLHQFLFWDVLPWEDPDDVWERRIRLFARWVRSEARTGSEIHRLEKELVYWKRKALTDPLTGLPNPRAFRLLLDRAMSPPRQKGKALVALLMADLDDFKRVNDRWGHPEGDRILRQVAMRLPFLTRKGGSVARVGGDEFALLLPETLLKEAWETAERMEQLFDTITAPDGTPWRLSGCVGIALYPNHAAHPEELIRRADEALYWAKQSGKRQIRVYGWDDFQ